MTASRSTRTRPHIERIVVFDDDQPRCFGGRGPLDHDETLPGDTSKEQLSRESLGRLARKGDLKFSAR
jgi:hypothetical protein